MVIYTCPTCNKEFNKKSNFIEHTEKKKKPCKQNLPKFTNIDQNLPKITQSEKKSDNLCIHCNKNFTTIYTLNRHLNGRCKVKNILDEQNEKNNNEYIIKLEEQTKKIDELYKKIEELEKKKTSNITINNTTNNTDNSVKNNVNNNIKLQAHGSEDLSKIELKTILTHLTTQDFVSIVPKLTKEIFRNKKRHLTAQLASSRCCLADLSS